MSITAGNDILASDFISASAGAGDSGKVAKLNASGVFDNTFIKNSFGGDGSDGSKTVSTDETLNPSYKVFNYTDLTINATKTLDFGSNFQNKIIHIKVQGDCVINGKLDAQGMGSVGGATTTAILDTVVDGNDGSDNDEILDVLNHFGAGGDGADTSVAGAGEGDGGSQLTLASIGSIYANQTKKIFYIVPGAGGGSGGAGFTIGPGAGGGDGGAGGNGGGALILEVGGNLTFGASSEISVAGNNGTNGQDGLGSPTANNNCGGGGGGGGGAGGMAFILYNGTITNSGLTETITGGDGGDGGAGGSGAAGTDEPGGEGGGGGGGYAGIGGDGGDGVNSGNTAPSGGAGSDTNGADGVNASGGVDGGAGGSGAGGGGGLIVIEKNTNFA